MTGKKLLTLIACIAITICAITSVTAGDAMNKAKEIYAPVPGGVVWLNPGDAYEHDTGLVRDAYGRRSYRPLNRGPDTNRIQPSYAPVHQPPLYAPPTHLPWQPFVQPNVIRPNYVQPYRPYHPVPYDTGPYIPQQPFVAPSCPGCARRPSSHSWGLRGDPMNTPKTGDAPTYR